MSKTVLSELNRMSPPRVHKDLGALSDYASGKMMIMREVCNTRPTLPENSAFRESEGFTSQCLQLCMSSLTGATSKAIRRLISLVWMLKLLTVSGADARAKKDF